MKAGARWYRMGSAITCDTAGGSGVGPAVIRYCLPKTMGRPRLTGPFAGKPANGFTEGAAAVLLQAEWWIFIRHQPLRVRVHPDRPAQHALDEVEHPARIAAREEDRKEGDEDHHISREDQEEQHDHV